MKSSKGIQEQCEAGERMRMSAVYGEQMSVSVCVGGAAQRLLCATTKAGLNNADAHLNIILSALAAGPKEAEIRTLTRK